MMLLAVVKRFTSSHFLRPGFTVAVQSRDITKRVCLVVKSKFKKTKDVKRRHSKLFELTSVAELKSEPQGVTSFSLLEPEQEPHQNVFLICTMYAKGVGAASVFLSGSA
jgi:hypothetical protein